MNQSERLDYYLKMNLAIGEAQKRMNLISPESLKQLAISDRLRRLRKQGLPERMVYLEEGRRVGKTEIKRIFRKLLIEEIKKILGCAKCNEKHTACLEFHHTEPKDKLYNVSQVIFQLSLSYLIHEMEKCILVCANCHKKEHHPAM